MKADYVHKDTLTATDYVELNKNNELLISYNQELLKENQSLKEQVDYLRRSIERKEETIIDLQNERVPYTNKYVAKLENQQKEFIKWLEDYLNLFDYRDIQEQAGYDMVEEILQKYKEITGE